MNAISTIKKNPLPLLLTTILISAQLMMFTFIYGFLSLHLESFLGSLNSSVQAFSSQSLNNPSFLQANGDLSLSQILFENQAVKDSVFGALLVYAFQIVLVFILVYLVSLTLSTLFRKEKNVLIDKQLIKFSLIWVSFFVGYKFFFLILELRNSISFAITGTASSVLYVFDNYIFIPLLFYFISISFILILEKENHFFRKSFVYGLTNKKSIISYLGVVLVYLVLTRLPNFVTGSSVTLVIISIIYLYVVIFLFSALIVGYFILVRGSHTRFIFKHFLRPMVQSVIVFFIFGLISYLFFTFILVVPSLESETLEFDLDNTYETSLRLENTQDIVLVEFVDFSCTYCKASQPLLEQLRSFYSYEDLSIVKRHYLLDESNVDTLRAAMFYECFAQQGGGDAASSILFGLDDFSVNTLLGEATLFGIDQTYYASCMQSQEVYETVVSDVIYAKQSGIQGTPAYVLINKNTNQTYGFHGTAQLEVMTSVIDSWLE